MRALRSLIVTVSALLAIAVLTGCAEDVTAIIGTDYPFEIYGLLDPTADTQFVRVAEIDDRLRPSRDARSDIRVTSVDLNTARETVWHDSLLTYSDGGTGRVFWSPFRPIGGHTYRITVMRGDGASSAAEVSVPSRPVVSDPIIGDGVTVPILIEGGSIRVRRMDVEYQLRYGWCQPQTVEAPFRYHIRAEETARGQEVDITLSLDREELVRRLQFVRRYDPAYGLMLRGVTVEAVITNGAWRVAGDRYDPEVLVEPGTLSNVENGFGFIGSGYVWTTTLRFTGEVLAAAGFTVVEPPRPRRPDLCLR